MQPAVPHHPASSAHQPGSELLCAPPPQLRACAFKVLPRHSAAQLRCLLPFVGRFTAAIIHDLAASGTCAQLEAYKRDLPASDSRGNVRLETTGEQVSAAARQCRAGLPHAVHHVHGITLVEPCRAVELLGCGACDLSL